MTRHKLNRNEFRLGDETVVSIEYWTDSTKVNVAAFDADGHQITQATYQASVATADDLNPRLQESLVNSLANALEYDLINNPELHVRKR
jgi:hypothetical protein